MTERFLFSVCVLLVWAKFIQWIFLGPLREQEVKVTVGT